jgi:multiple antibiotic resistance protein
LTQEGTAAHRKKLRIWATLTAFGVGLVFVVIGKAVFSLLGIQVADFLVAGGIILLILAIRYLITGSVLETDDVSTSRIIGVVPLGTPLVVGPAVLAALLMLMGRHHVAVIVFSFILNLVIQWALFRQATQIVAFLGRTGVTAVSKVIMLLLAAIAVKMTREGILTVLG